MAVLRAQGMTQKEVAEEMGVAQQTVSDLESITGNKSANGTIKSGNSPASPNHRGTSKTHTIARLKRDGHKDLAQPEVTSIRAEKWQGPKMGPCQRETSTQEQKWKCVKMTHFQKSPLPVT